MSTRAVGGVIKIEEMPSLTLVYKSLPVRFGGAYIRGKHKNHTGRQKSTRVFLWCVCWFLKSCFEQLFGEFVDIILDLFAAFGARVLRAVGVLVHQFVVDAQSGSYLLDVELWKSLGKILYAIVAKVGV